MEDSSLNNNNNNNNGNGSSNSNSLNSLLKSDSNDELNQSSLMIFQKVSFKSLCFTNFKTKHKFEYSYLTNLHSPFDYPFMDGESSSLKAEWVFEKRIHPTNRVNNPSCRMNYPSTWWITIFKDESPYKKGDSSFRRAIEGKGFERRNEWFVKYN